MASCTLWEQSRGHLGHCLCLGTGSTIPLVFVKFKNKLVKNFKATTAEDEAKHKVLQTTGPHGMAPVTHP